MSDKQQNNQLQVILKEQHIDEEQGQELVKAFGGPFNEAAEILANYKDIKVTDVDDTDGMKAAREKRLALKKARTTVENKRKELKEGIVKQGRAIDMIARYVKDTIAPAEEYLQLQEDYAKLEAKRQHEAKITKRLEQLAMRELTPLQYEQYDYEGMTDEQFTALLADIDEAARLKAEEAKRLEAERAAEAKAERKRQEAKEKEHERFKQLTALGLRWDGEQFTKDDINVHWVEVRALDDAKFDELVAELRTEIERRDAEAAKAQAEADKKLEDERKAAAEAKAKADLLERAKREREEQEAKEKREAEEAERAALLAPDKTKLIAFAEALELIRATKLPAMKTKQAQDIVNDIDADLTQLKASIVSRANKLK